MMACSTIGALRIWAFAIGCAVIVALVFVLFPPIAQDLAYHHFSDPRPWLGVPNFGDVVSNVAFVPAGLFGLWTVGQRETGAAGIPLGVFFVGVLLVAPGSAYYHWNPENFTMFWDRLPMTVAFMGLTATVMAERIDARFGVRIALPLLILLGLASVEYWRISEAAGVGDLRAYALVQFLPMLAIPALVLLFPNDKAIIHWRAVLAVFVCYALAKAMEYFDAQVLDLLGGAVSGHTLKHLFAALGPVALVMNLRP